MRGPQANAADFRFADRAAAGRLLGEALAAYADQPDLVVLGLPRGGVPVAFEVARELDAPLDVFVVRKLGVPGHEELAFGAVASGGVRVVDQQVVRDVGLDRSTIERVAGQESAELRRREQAYRGLRDGVDVRNRMVIVVDDGLATGSTMRAAVQGIRKRGAARVIVAVPTGSPEICAAFGQIADDAVCLTTPEPFMAVGLWYDDFRPTTDEEVRDLLARSRVSVQRTPGGQHIP